MCYPRRIFLQFGLHVCFIQIRKSFDVSKSIDLERVFGVKRVIMKSSKCQVSIFGIAEVNE